MAEKKLSKKALSTSFHHWYWGHLTCFSQEHMQTFGYLHSMLPLCQELYDNEEEKRRSGLHGDFQSVQKFNTKSKGFNTKVLVEMFMSMNLK